MSYLYFYKKLLFLLLSDPSRLHEEMTRYHVYLQVKKDLAEGRLAGAPFSTICLLTSYAAQVTQDILKLEKIIVKIILLYQTHFVVY